jgi:hypothetical protein
VIDEIREDVLSRYGNIILLDQLAVYLHVDIKILIKEYNKGLLVISIEAGNHVVKIDDLMCYLSHVYNKK